MNRPELARVPLYHELSTVERTGARHAWGVFGDQDELGTLNFITAGVVAAAAREATAGEVVNLSLPLDHPDPPLAAGRGSMRHGMLVERWGRDEAAIDAGALGIDRVARRGIVTRGVLVDVAAYLAERGAPIDPTARVPIGPDLVDEILAWERVEVRAGDVVLVRTGWLAWYFQLDRAARDGLAGGLDRRPDGLDCPGLDPGEATAAWLWDHRVAAVVADNPALEVLKVDPAAGFLHRLLIPLLGMPIGELWDLEGLSAACRQRRRYAFLLTSAPLYIPGGVGSPANAYAVL